MSDAPPPFIDYADVMRALRRGAYVVLVPCTLDGEPVLASALGPLDRRADQFSRHPDQRVRAAQAVGFAGELRAHAAEAWGFTPA